jgi:hypothetical protein
MHGVPVESALMATVELQKSVIVSRCKTPQKFDIPYFNWLCHLPRLDVSPGAFDMNYVSRPEEFHFLGTIAIRCSPCVLAA